MKHIFIGGLLLAAGMQEAAAQKIRIAPEIGFQVSNVRSENDGYDDYETQARLGLKVGGVVDISLNRRLSLQPGLFYVGKGFQEKYYFFSRVGNIDLRVREEIEYRIHYLEIPINLQYTVPLSRRSDFFFGGGPYIAFAVGGNYDYERERFRTNGNFAQYDATSRDGSLEIGNDRGEDNIKGTDAGINLNLGVMGRRGLYVRGNLGIGLANIVPGGDYNNSLRNFGGSLTVGYMFGR